MTKGLAPSNNEYWKLFSSKKPKGFGKFYEENEEQKSDSKDKPKSSSSEGKPKSSSSAEKPPPKSDDAKSEKKKETNRKPPPRLKREFGLSLALQFFENGSNKDTIFTIAMIATALALGTYSYYSYVYQEIGWKDLSR